MARLVAGPGVYICNECIDLCNQILDMEPMPQMIHVWHEQPDDELLASLARVQAAAPQLDAAMHDYVGSAALPRRQLDPHRCGPWRVQAGGLGAILGRGLTRSTGGTTVNTVPAGERSDPPEDRVAVLPPHQDRPSRRCSSP